MSTRKKDHAASGSAIAAGGAATAGVGLAAGGVPGAKSDFSSILNTKPGSGKGVKRAVSTVRGRAPAAKAAPGGILGFRVSAHRGGLYGFTDQARKHALKPVDSAPDAFWRGRNAGKIAPEEKVIRHMQGGKKAAGAALVGGAAATAYGLRRARGEVKKAQRDSDKYNGALLGAGAAGAGISHGATRLLGSQHHKWAGAASNSIDEAGKLVPSIGGRQGKKLTLKQMHRHKINNPGQPYPKTMHPVVSDSDIKRDPKLLHGVHPKVAEQAGRLRGAAAQQTHFAEVYRDTAKVVGRFRGPSAIIAGAGAGGLAMSRKKERVKKNMSAFGVEH